jgi:hypothetical protein
MVLASQVHRRTKEITSGFVSGWGRDHDSDTEDIMPACDANNSAKNVRTKTASEGRRRMEK